MPELKGRLQLLIATILLVPVLLYWGFGKSPQEFERKPSGQLGEEIDYYVTDAKLKEWDETGKLAQELKTQRLEHNPNLQQSHLQQPLNLSYRDDGTQVSASADSGTVMDDNSRVDLAGNVRVHDNPSSERGLIVSTEQISIYPKKDYAESSELVTIESDLSRISGVGMDTNFNERVLNLHSRVKGTHNNEK